MPVLDPDANPGAKQLEGMDEIGAHAILAKPSGHLSACSSFTGSFGHSSCDPSINAMLNVGGPSASEVPDRRETRSSQLRHKEPHPRLYLTQHETTAKEPGNV